MDWRSRYWTSDNGLHWCRDQGTSMTNDEHLGQEPSDKSAISDDYYTGKLSSIGARGQPLIKECVLLCRTTTSVRMFQMNSDVDCNMCTELTCVIRTMMRFSCRNRLSLD